MRLAAIYIENHEYIFSEPQTINFGGYYFYKFENKNNNIIVERNLNEKFIHNFFNITNSQSKITNLTAIVGQNGAGKSTLLDIIRSKFVDQRYAFPHSNSLFLIEDENNNTFVLKNDFKKKLLEKSTRSELQEFVEKKTRTIYYSPHYDYKFNPDFDDVDNHDLSFDKIIERDLKDLREKGSNEGGSYYSASQELIFKNSIRQITFLSSDLVREQNIFKNLFELQEHYEPILYFRKYKIIDSEWNIPNQFSEILSNIEEKLDQEIDKWVEIRKFKKHKVINQLEVNQYILKREVIKCIILLLRKQFEKHNSYLNEGYFPYDDLQEQIDSSNAYDTFLLFTNYGSIQLGSSEPENIFSENLLKNLLEKIYIAIENAENEDSVSNSSLRTSTKDAIEILRLQRQFINELNSYYIKFYGNKDELAIEDSDIVEEFISYMPFSRRMSSGEGALLNFYSRIYDFLNFNLKNINTKNLSEHYILLLDEADLTFHITWKKKYVKSLLSTLPYFFNELKNKPTLEIIFSTHDPITLSDLPNTNVIYIERPNYNSTSRILDFNNKRRPFKTFGANISELISDSFFIDDSLIGNFSFDKIKDAIKWLNDKKNLKNSDYYLKLIKTIDEPIVQRKLAEMYDEKTNKNFQIEVIDEQIKKLQELKNRLNRQ